MALGEWVSAKVFRFVHGNNLVYNTCWEDPRLDRVALDFQPDDNVLVITSAGCNALDYALAGVNAVHAVDMNPRQNALLDLKKSAIRNLDYENFFLLFGKGRHPDAKQIYQSKLRDDLPEWSQTYWDKYIKFFTPGGRPFYYRGTSGTFARLVRMWAGMKFLHKHFYNLLNAGSVEEQKEIYEKHIRRRFWTRTMRFAMNRDTTLSLVGVPKAQRRQVETQYKGGIVQFIQDCMEAVFAKLPISDNYFWRVYITGEYSPECCPEYLREDNFDKVQSAIERVHTHTDSVQAFLEQHDGQISKFVLLDHMDWLSDKHFDLLESEWQAIISRAAPNTRLIWRSGGLRTDFMDRVHVERNGEKLLVQELLTYNEELAEELHVQDRVHTYGSFYIADMAA